MGATGHLAGDMGAKGWSIQSIVSYVLAMQERLSKMWELVQQNLEQSQAQQ